MKVEASLEPNGVVNLVLRLEMTGREAILLTDYVFGLNASIAKYLENEHDVTALQAQELKHILGGLHTAMCSLRLR